jgi:hypothetical protein
MCSAVPDFNVKFGIIILSEIKYTYLRFSGIDLTLTITIQYSKRL